MRRHAVTSPITLATLFLATNAYAYIGPGAGLSAIGSALALLGAIFLMLVGFVWYPVKRLMRRRKAKGATQPSEADLPTDTAKGAVRQGHREDPPPKSSS